MNADILCAALLIASDKPPSPTLINALFAAIPKLDSDTERFFDAFSIPPPKSSFRPSSRASFSLAAPSADLPNSETSSRVRPSFFWKISNTGIPLSASLFKSSRPKPPAVVLANKSVIAFRAPTRSVVTEAISPNVVSNSSVGSIPAACSLMNVSVRVSMSNGVRVAKSLMNLNASSPAFAEPVTVSSVVFKSSALELASTTDFVNAVIPPTVIAPASRPLNLPNEPDARLIDLSTLSNSLSILRTFVLIGLSDLSIASSLLLALSSALISISMLAFAMSLAPFIFYFKIFSPPYEFGC